MFDRQRKALEANERYQKVKLHLETNKNAYLSGAAGIVIGFALKKRPNVIEIVNNVAPVIAPVFNNSLG